MRYPEDMENKTTTAPLTDEQVRRTVAAMAAEMPQRNTAGEDIADPDIFAWVSGKIDDKIFSEPKDSAYANRRRFILAVKEKILESPNHQPSNEEMGLINGAMAGVFSVETLIERL